MKNILIFYGTYGGGHLSAAKSIKEYLEENYDDVNVEMYDCIEYINKFVNKVSTWAYAEMAKKAPWAWKHVYSGSKNGALAKISTDSNKVMSRKLNKLIQDVSPDLIISTHPFSSQMCAELKKKDEIDCPIATIMTDFMPHNQWLVGSEYMDFFFVAHDKMRQDLIDYGIDENKVFATGIPLSGRFLKDYNREKTLTDLGLDPNKFTILYFAGGEFGLGRNTTFMVLKAIIRLLRNVQVLAVAGKNKKMQEKFEALVETAEAGDRVKVFSFINTVPEFMAASNMVITKPGGLTITESLASHLPIIVINPIPGQEEENAEFLVENNAAIWIKKDDNISRRLKELFRHPEQIEEMKKNATNLAKRNSTADICKTLMENEDIWFLYNNNF